MARRKQHSNRFKRMRAIAYPDGMSLRIARDLRMVQILDGGKVVEGWSHMNKPGTPRSNYQNLKKLYRQGVRV